MPLEEYTPDNGITSAELLKDDIQTVLTGQGVLAKYTVLGKITIGGKLKVVDTASADGSEAPYVVLGEETDTTGGDVNAFVYTAGGFNQNALTFGGTDTADDHRDAMHDRSLFISKPGGTA